MIVRDPAMAPQVDEWRTQILELATSLVEPVQVLILLAAFSLGLFTVRAIA